MPRRPPTRPTAAAVLLLACACGPPPGAEGTAAPEAPSASRPEEALAYLCERYDENGDGRVERREYPRSPRAFARLDHDGDGAVELEDLVQRRVRGRGEGARVNRAIRLLARYFQTDGRPECVVAGELGEAFAAYDADADGLLTEREFRARMDACAQDVPGDGTARVRALLEETDAWRGLADALGAADGGGLTLDAVRGFFEERARSGGWTFREPLPLAEVLGRAVPGRPLQGSPAPPFELREPRGRRTVSLAEHRGSRPVALIFGSFT